MPVHRVRLAGMGYPFSTIAASGRPLLIWISPSGLANRIGHPPRPIVTWTVAHKGRFPVLPAIALIHVSVVSGRCAAVFSRCAGASDHLGLQKGDVR